MTSEISLDVQFMICLGIFSKGALQLQVVIAQDSFVQLMHNDLGRKNRWHLFCFNQQLLLNFSVSKFQICVLYLFSVGYIVFRWLRK